MTDLHTRLRDADPLRFEQGLDGPAREAMRRAVVAAAEAKPAAVRYWRQSFALAAVAVVAVVGASAAYRFAEQRASRGVVADAAPSPPTQVQFRTPGGTRIIWTLDPSFHLGGTRP